MGKIKNFLCNQFLVILVVFILSTALSTGLQSLLIWISRLLLPTEDTGITIDVFIGFLLVLPLLVGAGFTDHRENGSILLSLLAVIGVYVCIVLDFNWFVLICCLVLIWLNLRRLVNIGGDSLWVYGIMGVYLVYCIGAYFAILCNGLEPAADIYGITVLVLATLGMLFIPAFD